MASTDNLNLNLNYGELADIIEEYKALLVDRDLLDRTPSDTRTKKLHKLNDDLDRRIPIFEFRFQALDRVSQRRVVFGAWMDLLLRDGGNKVRTSSEAYIKANSMMLVLFELINLMELGFPTLPNLEEVLRTHEARKGLAPGNTNVLQLIALSLADRMFCRYGEGCTQPDCVRIHKGKRVCNEYILCGRCSFPPNTCRYAHKCILCTVIQRHACEPYGTPTCVRSCSKPRAGARKLRALITACHEREVQALEDGYIDFMETHVKIKTEAIDRYFHLYPRALSQTVFPVLPYFEDHQLLIDVDEVRKLRPLTPLYVETALTKYISYASDLAKNPFFPGRVYYDTLGLPESDGHQYRCDTDVILNNFFTRSMLHPFSTKSMYVSEIECLQELVDFIIEMPVYSYYRHTHINGVRLPRHVNYRCDPVTFE